ncbi:hypothetical protein DLAC_08093 [Tieghemostelium lacteum]|uniref:Cytochrome b-c1 complex subunit 7 n=1 Tax=Tieghemostelium lacteum TaxID=361077 RepID=A0A151ZB69_TIELA|nr:hypothetical protein DLAC_08093 [Tieghemostelium lacteum]|eukprot:KYQ91181.1 hypothetical protein DLAC_08093 [Tieghemostelium lacteum]
MSALFKLIPRSFVKTLQNSAWLEHRKMGLYYADLYNETPVLQEVYRRMPDDLMVKRDRRLRVAMDLSVQKKLLPENEWSDVKEDLKYTEFIESEMKKVSSEFELRKAFRD